MRAKDVMSRPVLTLRPDDTIEQAAARLVGRNIVSAPVLDSTDDLVGMVSDGDLIQDGVPSESVAPAAARTAVVADVMTEDVVVADPDTDLSDVVKAMLEQGVRAVPVLADAELIGIISRGDILRTLIRTDDILQAEVQHRLDKYAGQAHRWTATVTDGTARIVGDFTDEATRTIVGILARTTPGVTAAECHHATATA